MDTDMQKEREVNYQFKILYAVGMIMVVANHCEFGGVSLFYELFPAYSFHVALFVFCSGYFYKDSACNHVGRYIGKKVRALLIPLYLWNFAYALFAQLMGLRGFTFGIGITFDKLLLAPIYSGHQFVYNLASWFIMPLFMTEVLHLLIRKGLGHFKRIGEQLYILIAALLGILGILLASLDYNSGWWLVLTRLCYFYPFYCGGYYYKAFFEKKDTISNFWYFFIVIGIQLLLIWKRGGTYICYQAWSDYGGFSLMPFAAGFLGIAFWLRIARILEPVLGRSKVVNSIAENSFSIMVNQFAGFMLVKTLFALGNRYFHIFSDFSMTEYKTNIWYYYCPGGLSQMRVIYVFFAILFGIGVQKALDGVRKKSLREDS